VEKVQEVVVRKHKAKKATATALINDLDLIKREKERLMKNLTMFTDEKTKSVTVAKCSYCSVMVEKADQHTHLLDHVTYFIEDCKLQDELDKLCDMDDSLTYFRDDMPKPYPDMPAGTKQGYATFKASMTEAIAENKKLIAAKKLELKEFSKQVKANPEKFLKKVGK
jgi:hypothetical protein